MSDKPFALRSRRVVTPQGVLPLTLHVSGEKIVRLAPWNEVPGGSVEDLGDRVVMAGLTDTHVHINEPGRTEWEGFDTATHAAAAGGITTLVDMPLNCTPVTVTSAALQEKLNAVQGKLFVDCGFWAGVVPGHIADLSALLEAGVLGAKAFLVHSGIDDFLNVTEADLRRAMPLIARSGLPLLAHAELDRHSGRDGRVTLPLGATQKDFLASRPGQWELDAIELLIRLSRETGCRVHIVHLSFAGALPALRRARAEGLPITVETCPHYLALCAEDLPPRDTRFKCAPPIRERANNEKLWEALGEGLIDFIASDHSPTTPEMKKLDQGELEGAWGGISSVQFSLPVVWTEAEKRGFGFDKLARWLCSGPADFAGLASKGRLEAGRDADLVVWDPEAEFTLTPDIIRYRHKMSAFEGKRLKGVVEKTYLRGRLIYQNHNRQEEFRGGPSGRPLLRIPQLAGGPF